MKSVVLEIKNNKAAVLDDRGVVHAVRDRGYAIGQVLELSELEMKQNEVRSGADRRALRRKKTMKASRKPYRTTGMGRQRIKNISTRGILKQMKGS